jgi:hypothetical protein
MKKIIAIAVVLGGLLGSVQFSSASAPCPAPVTQEAALLSASHVFAGNVTSITPSGDQWYPAKVTFTVTKYWKGTVSTTHTVHAQSGQFVNGGQYIVYLLATGGNNSYCFIRTINAAQITEETTKLGQGNLPPQFIDNPLPPPGPNQIFTRNLTIGSTGEDVISLQIILEQGNFLKIPQSVAFGYYGKLTQKAVADYQRSRNINPAFGYFGPLTRTKINTESIQSSTNTSQHVTSVHNIRIGQQLGKFTVTNIEFLNEYIPGDYSWGVKFSGDAELSGIVEHTSDEGGGVCFEPQEQENIPLIVASQSKLDEWNKSPWKKVFCFKDTDASVKLFPGLVFEQPRQAKVLIRNYHEYRAPKGGAVPTAELVKVIEFK